MAVVRITESFEEGSNKASWTLQDGRLDHSYTRVLVVETDSKYTLSHQVLKASGFVSAVYPDLAAIPSLGSIYQPGIFGEPDPFSILVGLDPERVGQSLTWKVTLSYESADPTLNNIDPTLNRPRIAWTSARYEAIAHRDIYGDVITNTAFDPPDPPVPKDANRSGLRISVTQRYFNQQLAADLENAVNEDDFAGYGPGCWRVASITGADRYDPGSGQLWDVDYEYEVSINGWDKSFPSAGYRELDENGDQVNIKDANGENVTSPRLLDADGHAITPGPSAPSQAVVLTFVVCNRVNYREVFGFSDLNFGTPPGQLPPVPVQPPTLPTPDQPAGPFGVGDEITPSNPER